MSHLTAIDNARTILHEHDLKPFAAVVLNTSEVVYVTEAGKIDLGPKHSGSDALAISAGGWFTDFDEDPAQSKLEIAARSIAAIVYR